MSTTSTSQPSRGISPVSESRLPSRHELVAAALVLRIVGSETVVEAQLATSYSSTATGGLQSVGSLRRAQRWLIEQGWLVHHRGLVRQASRCAGLTGDPDEIARDLMRGLLLHAPPIWVTAATASGAVRDEFLPTEADETLAQMFPDASEREALLLAAAQKYDETRLAEIGVNGELAVAAACRDVLRACGRSDLVARVRRVSEISDALGYDVVSPDVDGSSLRLEVKTFSGPHPALHLTRNEFNVGRRLSQWYLVLCRRVPGGEISVLGWTTVAALEARVPDDRSPDGSWEVTRIRLTDADLRAGVPVGSVGA